MSLHQVPTLDHDVERPLWSVMIPHYNSARFLRQAIQSVLQQDLGLGRMQIEVVDDCSSDLPEAVVEEIGKGRVSFHRNSTNIGMVGNWNECVRRARGHLVHILHHDDYVAPGFYESMERLASRHPDVSMYACRHFGIDEDGIIDGVGSRIPALESPTRDPSFLFYNNPLRCPCIVVRRFAYEQFGGFDPQLVFVSDWDMWARAINRGGGVMTSDPLAFYRTHGANQTAKLFRTGEAVRDLFKLEDRFASYRGFERVKLRHTAADWALFLMDQFHIAGDDDAYRNNRAVWREVASLSMRLKKFSKHILRLIATLAATIRRTLAKSAREIGAKN